MYLTQACILSLDGIIDNKETYQLNNINVYSEIKSVVTDLSFFQQSSRFKN